MPRWLFTYQLDRGWRNLLSRL